MKSTWTSTLIQHLEFSGLVFVILPLYFTYPDFGWEVVGQVGYPIVPWTNKSSKLSLGDLSHTQARWVM